MTIKRNFWVVLHRWAGLLMASFLIIAGLTGSLLAFHPELERLINPQLYPPQLSATKLDIGTLAELAEQRAPNHRVHSVFLQSNQGQTQVMLEPKPGVNVTSSELDFDQLIFDPYTGEELGRRKFGSISQGMINFMPFVYKLHYTLLLDKLGIWMMGICALIWTIDCFVGFYLTLPASKKAASQISQRNPNHIYKNWWQRWLPAWQVRWKSNTYKITFDLHRASSLWLWPMLLIFAWSSVYMNLWDSIYTWTTRAVLEYQAPWITVPKLAQPLQEPQLNWRQAQIIAEQLMAEHAKTHNVDIEQVVGMKLDRQRGIYNYTVRSSRDIQDQRGVTRVYFDANTGELKLATLPTKQHSGNTVTSWLYALHMGNVFGLPWRILVCVIGLVITGLSVTGILIWMKKRQARSTSLAINRKNEMILSRLDK